MDKVIKKARNLFFKNSEISYYVVGNKDKETILMLHPAFADHHIFEHQIDSFMNDYQVILIDMPGHGESQIIDSKVTLADMPEILNQILSENDLISCHLLGVSLGSLVAQAFADRYPEQVKSVIVLGGYSIHKVNDRIVKEQRKEGLKWLLYVLFSMKKFRNYAASVSCHTEQGRELFNRGAQLFSRKSFRAMAGMKTLFIIKAPPVPYPLLIINGEHDMKLAQDAACEMHKLETHSQFTLVQGAGHCANVDAPHEFNELVKKFLSSQDHKL